MGRYTISPYFDSITGVSCRQDLTVLGIGRNIAKLRRAKNLTQKELARMAGISVSYLSRIEEGDFPTPAAKTLARIAFALKSTVENLQDE